MANITEANRNEIRDLAWEKVAEVNAIDLDRELTDEATTRIHGKAQEIFGRAFEKLDAVDVTGLSFDESYVARRDAFEDVMAAAREEFEAAMTFDDADFVSTEEEEAEEVTTVTLLRKARALVAKGWQQGCSAKAADGRHVGRFDPAATCFCLMTAVEVAHGGPITNLDHPAYVALREALPEGYNNLSSFNDDADTLIEDVLFLYDGAISALEARVAPAARAAVIARVNEAGHSIGQAERGVNWAAANGGVTEAEIFVLAMSRILYSDEQLAGGARYGA